MTENSNTERLYTLLGDLSPDLLADAFPESGGVHNATSFRTRHAKRIGRMILLYAACVVLLIAAIVILPKIWSEKPIPNDPVTAPAGPDTVPWDPLPVEYPDDYIRPDLVWANEYFDPRQLNAVEGTYHTIDFQFVEDENAVYAVYLVDGQDNYTDCFAELSRSKAGWERINDTLSFYRIREATAATYYAATREQIESFYEYIETYRFHSASDPANSVHIRLGYQMVSPLYINGDWNPNALAPGSYYKALDCIVGSADPSLVPQGEQNPLRLTYSFSESNSCQAEGTHTLTPDSDNCELQVWLNGNWYQVPELSLVFSPDWITDLETEGSVSFDFPLSESMYGKLPAGKYRVVKPIQAVHITETQDGQGRESGGAVFIEFTIAAPND